jgi:SAM-dependent methyltransferase
MPSLEENLSVWDGSYDWAAGGNEWSSAWGGPEAQWFGTLLPRIHRFIPVGTILEVAPGYGRWTHYLKDYCDNLIVVDLAEKCIEACKKRFASCSHITYHVNDGRSLEMIPDESIDFVFSFDSLIHAEADVLEAYVSQLAKKLKTDGIGFIHHSNLGIYSELVALTKEVPPESRKPLIEKGDLIDLVAWHAESVTAKLFEEYCDRAGMQCVSQELINWFNKYLIGCLSVFTPKDSVWARPNRVLENSNFMDEVKMIAVLSQLYSTSPCIECFHDGANGGTVWGWAWDKHDPNARVAVDIYDGEALIALNVEATQYRSDLVPYTKDDGCHGFEYKLPPSVNDGQPHWIRVKISGTGTNAYGTPIVYKSS